MALIHMLVFLTNSGYKYNSTFTVHSLSVTVLMLQKVLN